MAGRTDQSGVLARQRKVGLLVVIKAPLSPIAAVVTRATGRRHPQSAFVVVVFVARLASHARSDEALINMAILAHQRPMFAQQRKAGQAMIEPDIFLPSRRAVAVATVPGQRTLMHVIIRMTG